MGIVKNLNNPSKKKHWLKKKLNHEAPCKEKKTKPSGKIDRELFAVRAAMGTYRIIDYGNYHHDWGKWTLFSFLYILIPFELFLFVPTENEYMVHPYTVLVT